jgi:ABC-type transport system involved in multi-copper enzyme maturation permease subunit
LETGNSKLANLTPDFKFPFSSFRFRCREARMNAKTTRILKEARPLFWPWCAVLGASALALLHPPSPLLGVSDLAFVLGVLLMATLPFGSEFQNRTFSLLLSQPISRMQIWREKLSIAAVVVSTAALVCFSCLRASGFHWRWGITGVTAIVFVASAPFWTLLTRSIVGGAVLNCGAYILNLFLGMQVFVWGWGHSKLAASTFIATMDFVSLGYAGLMLWLGWRKLARFQAIGEMAGDDLLTAGPDVLPVVWFSWLRCRPTGAVLNLMRKELRLLRPVWLISMLAAVVWVCLTGLRMLHPHGSFRHYESAVVSVATISTLIIAILAGSLPLGEERTSGTLLWHLTLPVSARRQWFIKLSMALFAGFVGAGLLPLLIAGRFLASAHMIAEAHFGRNLLVGVVLLTFAAFWCACAVKGTVPAVLWTLPVMIALYYAVELGKWAGPAFTNLFFARFDPFANLKFADAVSRLGSTSFFRLIDAASTNMTDSVQAELALTALILVPTLLYAGIQSYRLFRTQLQAGAMSLVRNLLPLAGTAFLCGFAALAFYAAVGRARNYKTIALLETVQAIQKLSSRAAKLDAAHPVELTVDDLAKAAPLSKSARRWLGNSHITLSLDAPPHQGRFGCAGGPPPSGVSALGYSWYTAIVPLADGSHLFMAFDPVTHQTISLGLCK